MKPRKILHIISKFSPDYPLFDDFVLGLDPRRFESTVCYLQSTPEPKPRFEHAGIEMIFLGGEGRRKRWVDLRRLLNLANIIKKKEISLIHCQRHKPTVYGVLSSLLSRNIPIISTVHGTRRTRSAKRRLVNRFLARRLFKIIAVSEAVRKDILDSNRWLPPEKVVAIQNGLSYSKILEASSIPKDDARRNILNGHEGDYWFGTAGRLAPKKNHERLVTAFAGLLKQAPNSILLIVGSGPLEKKLNDLVERLDLGERVRILGYRADIPEILRSLDAFVFPSLPGEGLPLAVLEAMASGLPLIISGIEAAEEIIGDTGCGIKVEPTDVDAIRNGMLTLQQLDAEARARMADEARSRALTRFTIDRMTKEVNEIYEGALSSMQ